MARVSRAFLQRDSLAVARELIGAELHSGDIRLRITETEAYRFPGDSANHCRMGRTPRNEPMWGRAGTAYVYLCYGVHHLLNVVTGEVGEGAAVLIRGAEVLAGEASVLERRGRARKTRDLLAGPGKVGQALSLSTDVSGRDLLQGSDLSLRRGAQPVRILVGPRIGIGYASARDQRAPYRFADASLEGVSHPKLLRRESRRRKR